MLGYSEQTRRKPQTRCRKCDSPTWTERKRKREKKKENETYHFKICHTSYQCLTIIVTTKSIKTSSRRDPVGHHHIISVVAEIIQTGGICTHSNTSMKDEHGDTFVPPTISIFILYCRDISDQRDDGKLSAGSYYAASSNPLFFFFSSLISFRFVRLYVLLSPSDCHDDHQAGNRLSGIRGRDIKKNQAIPGEWAPSSLVSVIGRRMSFQRAKLSDILLDNEQVVSIYKEGIFIPPLVPLQNVVAYNIIGRRRQPTRLTTGGPKDWRELLHGASTIRGM